MNRQGGFIGCREFMVPKRKLPCLADVTFRNDEILLASMGMSPMLWKIYAFSIGNFIIATFGGLYASLLGHIAPANFSFAESLIFFSIWNLKYDYSSIGI